MSVDLESEIYNGTRSVLSSLSVSKPSNLMDDTSIYAPIRPKKVVTLTPKSQLFPQAETSKAKKDRILSEFENNQYERTFNSKQKYRREQHIELNPNLQLAAKKKIH